MDAKTVFVQTIPLRLAVLLISFLMSHIASPAHADNISLFVVTGQSNARSQYAIGIEAGLRASGRYERVVVYNKRRGGNWLNQWIVNDAGVFLPGTNMLTDLWAPDGSSELQSLIDSLESEGNTVKLEGFFWFQGESDTINAGSRNTYQVRFSWMIEQLRNHYGAFDLVVTLIDWNPDRIQELLDGGYTPEGVEHLRDVLRDTAHQLGGITHDSRGYPRSDLWHVSVSNDSRGFYAAVTDLGADQAGEYLRHTSCPADLNGDGILNFFDITLYLQIFQAGCP